MKEKVKNWRKIFWMKITNKFTWTSCSWCLRGYLNIDKNGVIYGRFLSCHWIFNISRFLVFTVYNFDLDWTNCMSLKRCTKHATEWLLIMNKMVKRNISRLLWKLSFCAKRASSRFHASGFSFIDSKYVWRSFYEGRLTHFQTIFFLTGVHKYAEKLKRDVGPKSKTLTRKNLLSLPEKEKNIICT